MEKDRLNYIDATKGLLIVMVIIVHIQLLFDTIGVERPFVCFIPNMLSGYYTCFFMPAFFLVSAIHLRSSKKLVHF